MIRNGRWKEWETGGSVGREGKGKKVENDRIRNGKRKSIKENEKKKKEWNVIR